MIRTILDWPHPLLEMPSAPVLFGPVQQAGVRELVEDLIHTMRNARGVGIAAVQVGVPLRLFVLDVGGGPELYVNPIWTPWSGLQPTPMNEGCLSLQGEFVAVPRYERINVAYQDLLGHHFTDKPRGLRAQAFQHEAEHLDGKFFLDLVPEQRERLLATRARSAE